MVESVLVNEKMRMWKNKYETRYGTNFYGEVLKVNEMLLVRIVVYSMGVLRHFGT